MYKKAECFPCVGFFFIIHACFTVCLLQCQETNFKSVARRTESVKMMINKKRANK